MCHCLPCTRQHACLMTLLSSLPSMFCLCLAASLLNQPLDFQCFQQIRKHCFLLIYKTWVVFYYQNVFEIVTDPRQYKIEEYEKLRKQMTSRISFSFEMTDQQYSETYQYVIPFSPMLIIFEENQSLATCHAGSHLHYFIPSASSAEAFTA